MVVRRSSSVARNYRRREYSNEAPASSRKVAARSKATRKPTRSYDRSVGSEGSATMSKNAQAFASRGNSKESAGSFDWSEPSSGSATMPKHAPTPPRWQAKQPSGNLNRWDLERSSLRLSVSRSNSMSRNNTKNVEEGSRQGTEDSASPLPSEYWNKLEDLKFHYPGWERDYTHACEAYHLGEEKTFVKTYRKLRDKQRVYDDYKAFSRLNELANLNLTYPGCENDKEELEVWHLKNPSVDADDSLFQDKLEGLRNKQSLFSGDRSHPNIMALDELELTYPNWEVDYQLAVGAHCDMPARKFDAVYHRLQEKQRIYQGDRTHWRLASLDRLARTLTYPGFERDIADVENWHVESVDDDKNGRMFAEVLEGMKDQQQIYMGWDHQDSEESDDSQSASDGELSLQGDFYKLDLKDAKDMRKSYDSITESLHAIEGKRKQLVDARSSPAASRSNTPVSREAPSPTMSRRSPSPTVREQYDDVARTSPFTRPGRSSPGSSYHGKSSPISYKGQSSPSVPRGRTASFQQSRLSTPPLMPGAAPRRSNDRLPPKQKKFGNCVVCLSRPKTHVFVPCGHLCACAACSAAAMEENQCCPICRRQSDSSYRVFMT